MKKGSRLTATQRRKAIAALRLGSRTRWTKTPTERFWSKVDKRGPDECWPWTASLNDKGYGQMWWLPVRRPVIASRISWMLEHGRMPTYEVMHACDSPRCVNPAHLVHGTHDDNLKDAARKMRMAHGEKHYNSKLTVDDVHIIESMFASGGRLFELAALFAVDRMTITGIVTARTWKFITRAKRRLVWVNGEAA